MKFRTKPTDRTLAEIVRQIEDQVADASDLSNKANSVKSIQSDEPVNKDMKDGESKVYNDSGTLYLYMKVGGRLIKFQGTEVT